MQDVKASVLIVEDEPKLAQLLSDYLTASGFAARVIDNGLDVIPSVRDAAPDLILLDLMLPGKDGIDVCRELRAFSHVPIIMVTARVEEVDRLIGLEVGADDYVCKPYHPREVVARVRSQLRRAAWSHAPERQPLGGLVLEESKYEARHNGHLLDLTPVEFRLLNTLFRQPGRVPCMEQESHSDRVECETCPSHCPCRHSLHVLVHPLVPRPRLLGSDRADVHSR